MSCIEASLRAYTLVSSTPGVVSASGRQATCVAAVSWRQSLLLLLAHETGSGAGQAVSGEARLEVTQWLSHPSGPQAQGALVVHGRLLRVSPAGRRNAALHLWGVHPREELLDAVEGTGYSLGYLTVTNARWELPGREVDVDPTVLVTCARDDVLADSLGACEHLNSRHRDLACALVGRPAHFVELDRGGVTLGVDADDSEFIHASWPTPCRTIEDVLAQLRAVCPGAVARSLR